MLFIDSTMYQGYMPFNIFTMYHRYMLLNKCTVSALHDSLQIHCIFATCLINALYIVGYILCVSVCLPGLCAKERWRIKSPHYRRRRRSWPRRFSREREAPSPSSPWLTSESSSECEHGPRTMHHFPTALQLTPSLFAFIIHLDGYNVSYG